MFNEVCTGIDETGCMYVHGEREYDKSHSISYTPEILPRTLVLAEANQRDLSVRTNITIYGTLLIPRDK